VGIPAEVAICNAIASHWRQKSIEKPVKTPLECGTSCIEADFGPDRDAMPTASPSRAFPTVAFIGGGNMAFSLIGGLCADHVPAERIRVAEPRAEARAQLAAQFGVATFATAEEAVADATVWVLAVKPQVLPEVAQSLAALAQTQQPLILSIAAGIRSADLERWLGGKLAVVRTMPNTPALLRSGATGLYANAQVNATQREVAESILRTAGLTLWVQDETLMDAVTALSGSGPAYFFLVMEAMQRAGEELGLNAEDARLLTLQTALGAARMALESADTPATLRQKVTSPGGTTEAAIRSLQAAGLEQHFATALGAAADRAKQLADQFAQNDQA
jgi:pyrroline-5-carboxylate reductase